MLLIILPIPSGKRESDGGRPDGKRPRSAPHEPDFSSAAALVASINSFYAYHNLANGSSSRSPCPLTSGSMNPFVARQSNVRDAIFAACQPAAGDVKSQTIAALHGSPGSGESLTIIAVLPRVTTAHHCFLSVHCVFHRQNPSVGRDCDPSCQG